MTSINLLPWREEKRRQQTKALYAMMGMAVVLTILVCILLHLILAKHLKNQYAVNDYLTGEIAVLNQQIAEVQTIKQQKAELITRMEIVHQLQNNRMQIVKVFDEFVRTLPNGVYITSISKEGDKITVTGQAESNSRVSEFMKNIEQSASFRNPILTEIRVDNPNTSRIRYFALNLEQEQKSLADDNDEKMVIK